MKYPLVDTYSGCTDPLVEKYLGFSGPLVEKQMPEQNETCG